MSENMAPFAADLSTAADPCADVHLSHRRISRWSHSLKLTEKHQIRSGTGPTETLFLDDARFNSVECFRLSNRDFGSA
jgi:hypothetical protein